MTLERQFVAGAQQPATGLRLIGYTSFDQPHHILHSSSRELAGEVGSTNKLADKINSELQPLHLCAEQSAECGGPERALFWDRVRDCECDLLHCGGGVHGDIDLDWRGDEGNCGDRSGGEGANHGGS